MLWGLFCRGRSRAGEADWLCREHPIAGRRQKAYGPPMNLSLKRLALVLLAGAFFALLSTGCQTSKGFGKDVEKLGDKIQDKAG